MSLSPSSSSWTVGLSPVDPDLGHRQGSRPYLLGLRAQSVVGDAPQLPVLHARELGPLRRLGQRGAVGSWAGSREREKHGTLRECPRDLSGRVRSPVTCFLPATCFLTFPHSTHYGLRRRVVSPPASPGGTDVPGEPRERCRWTWQACPLEGEFSFLAEGVGRARTPWGDEGPWGLSCGAGISRATEHADHTPHRPATPSRSEEGSLTELGGPHPAPPAAGQLPGQPPAPGPRQAALSCLRLGGPLSGPLACGWDWAATLTPGLS